MLNQLNPDVTPFQRSFVSQIRRLDDMDRIVRFLQQQMTNESVPVRPLEAALPFVNGALGAQRGPALVEDLASKLKQHEDRLSDMNGSYDQLQKRLLELEEARHVLRETAVFFDQAEGRGADHGRASTDDASAPLLEDDIESRGFGRNDNQDYATFDLE